MEVPYTVPVHHDNDYSFRVNHTTVEYLTTSHHIHNAAQWSLNAETLPVVYQHFINTPYLWGGKSVFGIDCSGFVQQVFKMFGIKLLRDAYLQAEQGESVSSIEEGRAGDLAFFQNEKGRVTHVGLILEKGKIIHASGKVRIDTIDKEGIVTETGERTHIIHSVRRIDRVG